MTDRFDDFGSMSTADLARPDDRRDGQPQGTAEFAQAGPAPTGQDLALFPPEDAAELRHHWDSVQSSFVDEPRRAVEQADALVAGAMKRLAETFADERARLERQWDREGEASTEDLRVALQRYRAFFGRLLAV